MNWLGFQGQSQVKVTARSNISVMQRHSCRMVVEVLFSFSERCDALQVNAYLAVTHLACVLDIRLQAESKSETTRACKTCAATWRTQHGSQFTPCLRMVKLPG